MAGPGTHWPDTSVALLELSSASSVTITTLLSMISMRSTDNRKGWRTSLMRLSEPVRARALGIRTPVDEFDRLEQSAWRVRFPDFAVTTGADKLLGDVAGDRFGLVESLNGRGFIGHIRTPDRRVRGYSRGPCARPRGLTGGAGTFFQYHRKVAFDNVVEVFWPNFHFQVVVPAIIANLSQQVAGMAATHRGFRGR